jgi:hypothetical protein
MNLLQFVRSPTSSPRLKMPVLCAPSPTFSETRLRWHALVNRYQVLLGLDPAAAKLLLAWIENYLTIKGV